MGRKIIFNLAVSLDGYIADEHGGYEWITGDGDSNLNTEKQFSFPEFLENVDTVVMGRKAFEDCNIEEFNTKHVIVATSNEMNDYDNIEFINNDICDHIRNLQKGVGKDIWLFGGGGLVDCFIKKDMIDEYIVGIVPTILGKGIPLFHENNPTLKLHLVEFTIQEGLTILKYVRREN